MIDDKVFPPVKSEQDLADGVETIGEALSGLEADEVDADNHDVTVVDELYPSGLSGAIAAIVRDEPVKALVWAAALGIAIGLLTSK